jgi:hypothetical protein
VCANADHSSHACCLVAESTAPKATHVWQQVLYKLLIHQGVVSAHTDTQAGYVGDGAQQTTRNAAGQQPVHIAWVA